MRICFWVLFLLGPALGCLAWTKPERWLAMLPQPMRDSLRGLVPPAPMFWVALLAAAAGAAWCLVQLHVRPKSTFSRTVTTLAFTAMILVTYAVLAVSVLFVGCLMGMGR